MSPPPARVRLRTREAGNIPHSLRRALRGALAAGREKEGELATTSLEFENLGNADAEMTLVMTSLTLASVFQCLFTFALVSASC